MGLESTIPKSDYLYLLFPFIAGVLNFIRANEGQL